MSNINESDNKMHQKEFDDFIHAIGTEIEQAQVKIISVANVQMLLHYWKVGNFILFNQKRLGWGSKVIDKISKAIRMRYPEKKGYSPRNLTYMCQFARLYSLETLQQLLFADKELETPSIGTVLSVTKNLNELTFTQEPPAQIQSPNLEEYIITQELPAQIQNITETLAVIMQQPIAKIENDFVYSPVSKINWSSHMVIMDSKLPLGAKWKIQCLLTP